MTDLRSRRAIALGLAASALTPTVAFAQNDNTYSEPEIVDAAERFFGAGAEGVAAIVDHVFSDLGRPNAYIEGEEGSGAIGVGLRYGNGYLRRKGVAGATRVYWQGPSVGFDTGGNASKVFTLVYNLHSVDQIFRRYPGVDGSAYFIGGVGVNYQRRDDITLAPMRAGVGFRLGANVGYLAYSRRRRINPF
ncbi:MAG: DUF1134 domain-containing protein [Hyphomonadaceae bacterium]|nr:DUF1134 domain-containing protein [Hyphomonadaceae bacterium]